MILRFLFCTLFGLLSLTASWAQNGEIRGTVKDRSNESVVGARVVAIPKDGGPQRGAVVSSQGQFTIRNLPAGEYTVSVSAIGFKEQKKPASVAASSAAELAFVLAPSVSRTEEVVVTGQGAGIERKKLAVNVESLNIKDIENTTARSFDQLIQGRVPGLTSFSATGMPGAGARIATRGVKSASGPTTPVIYIDGVRVDAGENFRLSSNTGGVATSALSDLLNGDIERVEFLKGGASSTLFGSEAANGVIQIFTKKGVPGTPKYTVGVTGGIDAPETKFVQDPLTRQLALQNGIYQEYKVGVTGGSDNITYNASGRMLHNTGITPKNQSFERVYSMNGGLRAGFGRSSFEFSMNYVRNQFGRTFNNNNSGLYQITEQEANQVNSPANPRWRFENVSDPVQREALRARALDSLVNYWTRYEMDEVVHRFIPSLTYKISPVEGWNNRFTVGIDYRKSESRIFEPINVENNGSIDRVDRENMIVTFDFLSSLKLPTIGTFWNHDIAVGLQGYRRDERPIFSEGDGFGLPGTSILTNTAVKNVQEAPWQIFTGGVYANYKAEFFDVLFLDVGGRLDINSTFGDRIASEFFPKAALALNVADLEFWTPLKDMVNTFKLRASYGETGLFPTPFTRDRTYISRPFQDQVGLGIGGAQGGVTSIPGNANLTVERVGSFEAGTELSFLEDRLSLTFDYFNTVTRGAIFNVPVDPVTGFTTQDRNVGRIANEGIELGINALAVSEPGVFDLNIRASIATLRNRVESLGGAAPFQLGGSFVYIPTRIEEGFTLPSWRINAPIADADGSFQTGQVKRDSLINGPVPTFTGNFGFDATIAQNLTLNVTTEFATGFKVVNHFWGRRYPNVFASTPTRDPSTGRFVYPFYQDIVDNPNVPKFTDQERLGRLRYQRNDITSLLMVDGTWFKIREISLSYRVPAELIGFKGLVLGASLRNALVVTANPFVDPELTYLSTSGPNVGGTAAGNISPPRMFRFSINYTFQ
jgi:TonB-dependent SusC/RagA subfamily outer membrane receptor